MAILILLMRLALSFTGWLVVATVFDRAFFTLSSHRRHSVNRRDAAILFWCAVCIIAFAATGPAILPHVLTAIPIAVGHVHLIRHRGRRVNAREIVSHLLATIKREIKRVFQ